MLIFIFIVTEITIEPCPSFVLFNMSVEISNIFEMSITILFHALWGQVGTVGDLVLCQMTFKWETHATSVTDEP